MNDAPAVERSDGGPINYFPLIDRLDVPVSLELCHCGRKEAWWSNAPTAELTGQWCRLTYASATIRIVWRLDAYRTVTVIRYSRLRIIPYTARGQGDFGMGHRNK